MGKKISGAHCESLVLEALQSERGSFRPSTHDLDVAKAFEKASRLYVNGNESMAYETLYSLSIQSGNEDMQLPSAPVFFASEKGRLQNQRQIQRENERVTKLTCQESRMRQDMSRIDQERVEFGESLQLSVIQRDDTKTALERIRAEVDKLNKANDLMQAKSEDSTVVLFMGFEKLMTNVHEVREKAKLLEIDLQRKEDTVLSIQHELCELHNSLRSLQSTLELVQTSLSDTRLVHFELQRSTKDVEDFVKQSATSLFHELSFPEKTSCAR